MQGLQGTRIIVVGLSRLLSDLLEDVIGQTSDMTVVARLADAGEVVRNVHRFDAHVVIFNLTAERLEEVCRPLFRAFPDLLVVSFTDRDRLMLQCQLMPQVSSRGEASIPELIGWIRNHARGRLQ